MGKLMQLAQIPYYIFNTITENRILRNLLIKQQFPVYSNIILAIATLLYQQLTSLYYSKHYNSRGGVLRYSKIDASFATYSLKRAPFYNRNSYLMSQLIPLVATLILGVLLIQIQLG